MAAGVRYGVGVLLTALGLVVATAGLVAMVTPGLGPQPEAVAPIDLDETDSPTSTPAPSDAPRAGAGERGAVAIGPPGGAEGVPPDTDATTERDTEDAGRETGVAALDVVAAGSGPAPGGQDDGEPADTPAVADVPAPDAPSPEPAPDVPSPDPAPDVPSPDPAPDVPSPDPAPDVPSPDPTPQEPAPSPDPGTGPSLDPVAWRDDDRGDTADDRGDEPDPDDDSDDDSGSEVSDHSRDDTDDSRDESGPPGHARHDPAGDHDARHARAHDNH